MNEKSWLQVLSSCSENRKSKIEKRPRGLKWLGLSVIACVLVVAAGVAEAQQPKRVPRIGYLSTATADAQTARTEAFREGLRQLGYVEGKNITIEYRHAEGKPDRLPDLAAELVRLNVDIIVAKQHSSPCCFERNQDNPDCPRQWC